ncbi:MAG: YbjN domain-containing protein [Rhizobiales bacterium]|nr:YbjN domain-containing protein [Hyphomicrobiales bacterium]
MMKRPPIFATLAALAALTVFAPTADAQKRSNAERGQDGQSAPSGTVGRIMPQQMAAVLRNRGMQAEVLTENNRSRIRTMIGGRRVTVFFYACNDGGCQSIQYRALYEKNDRFTLAFVNAWNYEKRFAKTYLDSDNDLVLEWDVDFDGGVNVGFISESVATFQTMINAFDRFTPRNSSGGSNSGGGSSGGSSSRSTSPAPAPAPTTPPADPTAPPATGGKGGGNPTERRT